MKKIFQNMILHKLSVKINLMNEIVLNNLVSFLLIQILLGSKLFQR